MLIRFIWLFALCLFYAGLYGETGTVFGMVRDLDNNAGIDYVTVYVEGTQNAVETDQNGLYRIQVEAGKKIQLKFSRIGYSEISVNVESMKPGQKRNINVKMVPKTSDIEVVVSAGKIEDVGMVREEVTELKILPTASGNFESVLPHIAMGVNAGSGGELTSPYNVRGGNYDENLIYVNDFEIFRPQLIRSCHLPFAMRMMSSVGPSVAYDHGSPVSDRYDDAFPFEGHLERVDITLIKPGAESAPSEAAEDAATDERSTMSRQ